MIKSLEKALCSGWLMALCLESPPSGVSGWGIVDQEWYPYFKKDLEEGRLTLEKAADLIGCALSAMSVAV